jgi:hypothetical protein
MLFPASLISDANIIMGIGQSASASFLPDRANDAAIPARFCTCPSHGSGTTLIYCFLGAGMFCGASGDEFRGLVPGDAGRIQTLGRRFLIRLRREIQAIASRSGWRPADRVQERCSFRSFRFSSVSLKRNRAKCRGLLQRKPQVSKRSLMRLRKLTNASPLSRTLAK